MKFRLKIKRKLLGGLLLTLHNYKSGFLVDDECLAGVVQNEDCFYAYVLKDGQIIAKKKFMDVQTALDELNSIQRNWVYTESAKACGKTNCEGQCKGCGNSPEITI